MGLAELANLGEFVGGIAVVVSLVFVGVQIRQNTKSVRSQSELTFSYKVADFHRCANDNPELSRIFDQAISDPESLSDDDVRRLRWFIAEIFCIYDGAYHLYKQGQISEPSWRIKMASIKAFIRNPVLKEWWDERMTPLSSEFIEYVNQYETDSDEDYDYRPISRRNTDIA